MQMNLECIKDVLLYCVNNIKIKKVGNDWKIDKVNLETLYNADELKKYDQIDIMYSVLNLTWLKPRDSWELPTTVRIFTKLSRLFQPFICIITKLLSTIEILH